MKEVNCGYSGNIDVVYRDTFGITLKAAIERFSIHANESDFFLISIPNFHATSARATTQHTIRQDNLRNYVIKWCKGILSFLIFPSVDDYAVGVRKPYRFAVKFIIVSNLLDVRQGCRRW